MIRIATENDIARIKELWEQGFNDPLNYVDFFYSNVTTPSHTYLCEDGPGVIAMATIIPTMFMYKDKSADVSYIYGAATDKRFQGQGYMSTLLKHCERVIKDQGCSMSVLVPGDRHLFDYYKRRGYNADFSLRIVKIRPGMISSVREGGFEFSDGEIGEQEMFGIREASLANTPHIAWTAPQLSSIIKDCAAYGEKVAYCGRGEEKAYAVYGMEGKKMYIKECLGTSPVAMTEVIARAIDANDPSGVTVRLAADAPILQYEGETVRFGMAKQFVASSRIKDMEPYMNLMFD